MEFNSSKIEEIRRIRKIEMYRNKFTKIPEDLPLVKLTKIAGVSYYRLRNFIHGKDCLSVWDCEKLDCTIVCYIQDLLAEYQKV